MLAIALVSCIMTVGAFIYTGVLLADNKPRKKVSIALATLSFLLLGGIFIWSAPQAKPTCESHEQLVPYSHDYLCIPDNQLADYLEGAK